MRAAPLRARVAGESLVFPMAVFVGLVPSIAVLYHALRTYDYPYTDHAYFETRRVFLGLAVGMILGTASGAITVGLRGYGVTGLASLLLVLLLLALFEEGFKLVYLNRKGYRARFDTTFVGVTLALGIAALVAAGSAYTNGPALFQPGVFLPLLAFSVSLAFLHAATGALIGFGCAKGPVPIRFVQAYVARVLHAAMLVPFFVWPSLPQTTLSAVLALSSLLAATMFAVVLYGYVYRSVLPVTLPPEMQRARKKRARKAKASDE